MKTVLVLTSIIALAAAAGSARADETYYPYQFYEEYYRQQQEPPPAAAPQEGAPPRPVPSAARRAPLFLFPPELGFGVAVAAEDLFYLAPAYFKISGGGWHRSGSWQGPWKRVPRGKLPPELGKQTLAKMRALRDREFRLFWEQKGNYRGRVFRPGAPAGKPGGKRPN
ncbi:hypothetical protein [Geomonas subterranea]|uniref:Uncharacterized protein n=1 Tax=Geomonas subterranea TaxID=2847989 RepID=A0ABX8LGM8_9BACT|nr:MULTISPECIES: hypothetical protein [Geomonas]QXE90883.1 hypothetical protein KP001_21330 [Geomonas subterranea]QXM11032.1 hypothetical protein KP002_07945 [Geomonas subterranea]